KRSVIELARRFERRGEIGNLVTNRLEPVEGAPERATRPQIRACLFEGVVGPRHRTESAVETFAIERLLNVGVTASHLAEQTSPRNEAAAKRGVPHCRG